MFIPAADFCGRTSVSSVSFFFPQTAVFCVCVQNSFFKFLCVNKTINILQYNVYFKALSMKVFKYDLICFQLQSAKVRMTGQLNAAFEQ